MGIIDTTLVDTAPGGYPDNPFAPPTDWEGDDEAFLQLMRERFQRDPWLCGRGSGSSPSIAATDGLTGSLALGSKPWNALSSPSAVDWSRVKWGRVMTIATSEAITVAEGDCRAYGLKA